MPVSPTTLFRALIVGLMALHVFYMYSLARALQDTVGVRTSTVLLAAGFALVMMVPLVWAVGVPELPEAFRGQRRQNRWKRGVCPECAYPIHHLEAPNNCPECATSLERPAGYRLTAGSVRRFVGMVLLAWALGSVGAEVWAVQDERDFLREAAARSTPSTFGRERRWPVGSTWLIYDAETGRISASSDPVAHPLLMDPPRVDFEP